MDTPTQPPPLAWQPLTPRGVAAFARARAWNLFLVQLLVALLAAATVVWFLASDWFPVVRAAINRMPEQGQVRSARLEWGGPSPVTLAENHFLALSVDLNHEGQTRSPAHIQAEFGRADCRFFSLLGFWQYFYPPSCRIAFNRPELAPWWDAWSPALLALAALSVVVWLMLCWTLLATVYFFPVWLAAFFANRDLSLRGSWYACGAALMPGAVLLIVAIFIYGAGALDLVRLGFATMAHFALTWIYLALTVFFLPRHPGVPAARGNPFATTGKSG